MVQKLELEIHSEETKSRRCAASVFKKNDNKLHLFHSDHPQYRKIVNAITLTCDDTSYDTFFLIFHPNSLCIQICFALLTPKEAVFSSYVIKYHKLFSLNRGNAGQ